MCLAVVNGVTVVNVAIGAQLHSTFDRILVGVESGSFTAKIERTDRELSSAAGIEKNNGDGQ